jgi:hypothetical protein
MANRKNAFFNSTNGWTGVQPAMKYEYYGTDPRARNDHEKESAIWHISPRIPQRFYRNSCVVGFDSWQMERSLENSILLVKNSTLYKEFSAEREEILRHKWIESEKVGYDIGFERALFDWIVKYRSVWLDERRR